MALSGQEVAVADELARVLARSTADLAYDQLPESYGGRLLNADVARELSRAYRSKFDRIAFTRCTYGPASAYVLGRYHRELARPGPVGQRAVLLLAGGAASGKTSSVGEQTIKDYDLVFDSNLADVAKAVSMIETAVSCGWVVDVSYIHRPYELALRSMVQRAIDTGRYIPVGPPSKLARLHLGAQRTIVTLHSKFRSDWVDIRAYANLWTPEHPVDAHPLEISELARGRQFHYDSLESLHDIESTILPQLEDEHFGEGSVFDALREVET
jgi:hypothetical protein